MTNTKLIFAVKTTTEDGNTYAPGTSGSVPAAEARNLVHRGRARLDDGSVAAAKKPAKKAAVKKTAAKKVAAETKTDEDSGANPGGGNDEGDQS